MKPSDEKRLIRAIEHVAFNLNTIDQTIKEGLYHIDVNLKLINKNMEEAAYNGRTKRLEFEKPRPAFNPS